LKVPPVALAVLVALVMWGASLLVPPVAAPSTVRVASAAVLWLAGAGISLAGVFAFRRAKTSVNPTKPDSVSALVSGGIYRVTRNPMYLGFLLMLLGWAAFLWSIAAAVVAMSFVLYMNRFQIAPEERALAARFGAEFSAYKARVRRWL